MKITFYGAAGTVTGSEHLLTVGQQQVLLDCGLFQGRRADTYVRNKTFPFSPRELDAVVLSHAHIDHSGNLPNLVASGYNGEIHSTHATRDLCSAMLQDSGSIQESDAEFVSKYRAERGEPPVEPLYTVDDAINALRFFQGHPYGRPFDVAPGVRATYCDAGHILGSALTVLELQEGERAVRVCYTGDLGRRNLPILRDPEMVSDIDVLVMESTYGDKEHDPIAGAEQGLKDAVREAADSGGKIIVPAFAVGRAQEIVYSLHQMSDRGDIPRLPVFVDSPLAVNVSEVFRLHPECYDAETARFIAHDPHGNAFGWDMLTYVHSKEESKKLNDRRGPFIVISASGMAEAGRVVHHLRNSVGDPRNIVLITGWAAPDTLARKLADGMPIVRIFGEEHKVRASVRVLHGFSAHADRSDLIDYATQLRGRLKRVYLVHGEAGPAESLAAALRERGLQDVIIAQRMQEFEL